mmetsp:Transcript_51535/g.85391  ORF Transcript_51535/g.85391 Transcript_51535/m.85391 type:complete len:101 (+) Transcript_51535:49-351(+)
MSAKHTDKKDRKQAEFAHKKDAKQSELDNGGNQSGNQSGAELSSWRYIYAEEPVSIDDINAALTEFEATRSALPTRHFDSSKTGNEKSTLAKHKRWPSTK